jgi:hypothetical protein
LTLFLQSRSVSLFDIYTKNPELDNKINSILEMKKLINSYDIENYYTGIVNNYKKALKHYEVDIENVNDLLENRSELMELKVNALYAYEKLKPKQFKKGNYSNEAPKYNKNIYAFNDVNILLNTIMNNNEFNGITLSLIIDKNSFEYSYFCFVIKNGDNVYLIGDIPDFSHPNQKHMRRTPGRQMESRINMFNFPYELLALTGDRYCVKSESNALCLREDYNIIGTLSSCNKYSIIWIINMMSILKEKFFDNHIQTDEIYYTGGMIEMEGIEQKEYSLAIKKDFTVLELNRMDKKEAIDCDIKYSRPSRGETKWIVERYINEIDDDLINSIAEDDYTTVEQSTEIIVADTKKQIERLNENYSTIATKEEFEYRHKWISRYNIAKATNILFEKEWRKVRCELEEWYKKTLEDNLENILKAIAFGEFITEEHDWQKLTESGKAKFARGEKYSIFSIDKDTVTFGRELNVRDINILSIQPWNEESSYAIRDCTMLFKKDRRNLKIGWHYGCVVDGKNPGVVAIFNVTSPKAIADLCGLKIEDMPVFLQHYCKTSSFHDGNCILDNIDPMDWVINNYISEFSAKVGVVLSKTTYNNLRKKYGLKPNKIW